MSLLYFVDPLNAEIQNSLSESGVEFPSMVGRDPTPNEIREAVDCLDQIVATERGPESDGRWEIHLEHATARESGGWTTLMSQNYTAPDQPCEIWFRKGRPHLMVQFLVLLSFKTGPLVVSTVEDDHPPAIIWSGKTAAQILKSWGHMARW